MGLFDRIRIRLNEVKKEPPIESGSVDPANQQGAFRKNERNKKKIMRKLEPKGPKQGELNLGNTKTTNTPLSTKRTLKGRPLGSKTKSKGETYKQLTTGAERQRQRKDIKKQFKTQQPISDLKKAKKYAKGEYPKIGGGGLKPDIKKPVKGTTPVKTNISKVNVDKIFSGTGNVKKGGNVPDKNINPKSKGTTPVKTNVSKINVDKVFDKPKNPITKTIGVKQSEVSKKAKKFTKDINKANVKRQETVAKRKYFRGRKAERLPGRSGEKPTGSIARGTYKSSPTGQRAYDYEKMKIDTRDQLKRDKNFDKRITKGLKKRGVTLPKGVTPSSIVKQDAKKFLGKVKSGDQKAYKDLMDIVDKDYKKMTPAQQSQQAKRIFKIQKAKGRVFDPKTLTFKDPLGIEQQAKKYRRKEFPGEKKYQAAKSDLEARKGFKGSKPGGLKADERNPFVKRSVRKGRVDDLGGDIYKQPKVTDKDFAKGLKDVKKAGKKFIGPRETQAQVDKRLGKVTDPFGKPTIPGKSFKQFRKDSGTSGFNAKAQAIKNLRASDQRLGKPLSKVQQRKAQKAYNAKQLRDLKIQREYGGGLSGTIGPPTEGPTKGVNQADVSKKAKRFSDNISRKVQMRSGATSKPSITPPKKYNIPADDRPGKLVQGRDFPSKKAYDAKIAKQVKILRQKANNLAVAKYKAAGELRPTDRKTGVFSSGVPLKKDPRTGELSPTPISNKLRDRQNQRTKAADALERSLKRQGTTGPTSMLPVVSGKGADAKMPGMGGKTYKQFYKDANVGKYKSPTPSAMSGSKSKGISPVKINIANKSKELAKLAKQNRQFYRSARKITKMAPVTKGITKTLARLGPQGRAAAAIGTVALSSPTIRKALGGALLGGGLGAFAGKKDEYSKQLKLGDGIKAVGPVKSTYSLSKPKFDKGTKVSGGYVQNPKDVAKMKEKRKNYVATKK